MQGRDENENELERGQERGRSAEPNSDHGAGVTRKRRGSEQANQARRTAGFTQDSKSPSTRKQRGRERQQARRTEVEGPAVVVCLGGRKRRVVPAYHQQQVPDHLAAVLRTRGRERGMRTYRSGSLRTRSASDKGSGAKRKRSGNRTDRRATHAVAGVRKRQDSRMVGMPEH